MMGPARPRLLEPRIEEHLDMLESAVSTARKQCAYYGEVAARERLADVLLLLGDTFDAAARPAASPDAVLCWRYSRSVYEILEGMISGKAASMPAMTPLATTLLAKKNDANMRLRDPLHASTDDALTELECLFP